MALVWDIDDDKTIEFDELVAHFDALGAQLFQKNLDCSALMMRRICNNRRFLAEHILGVLRGDTGVIRNDYSAQIFVLHSSEHYLFRAVLWPTLKSVSGEETYNYELPHDHDFNFFTAGYLGSGYRTRIYEYDHASVSGLPGEDVALHEIQDLHLSPDRVMLFRRSVDVHTQYVPKEFSISLNILQNTSHLRDHRPQYEFDIERGKILRTLNGTPIDLLAKVGASIGGDCAELVAQVATISQYPSARRDAIGALARHCDASYMALAEGDDSAFVRHICRIDAEKYGPFAG